VRRAMLETREGARAGAGDAVSPRGRRARRPGRGGRRAGRRRAQGRTAKTPLYMISVVAELLGVHPRPCASTSEGYVRPRRTRGGTRCTRRPTWTRCAGSCT
jgi:hypothetical protein